MGRRVGEWQVQSKKLKKNPQIMLINNSEYAGMRGEEEEEKHKRKGLFHHNA